MDVDLLEERLKALSKNDLKREWRRRLGSAPPKVRSVPFLRRLLLWNLQSKLFGGLSPRAKRRLRRLAQCFDTDRDYSPTSAGRLKPGTVLARVWDGRRHDVLVQDEGFVYADREYKSLSEVARAITGTRWSGPLFFGLKEAMPRGSKK